MIRKAAVLASTVTMTLYLLLSACLPNKTWWSCRTLFGTWNHCQTSRGRIMEYKISHDLFLNSFLLPHVIKFAFTSDYNQESEGFIKSPSSLLLQPCSSELQMIENIEFWISNLLEEVPTCNFYTIRKCPYLPCNGAQKLNSEGIPWYYMKRINTKVFVRMKIYSMHFS